MKETACKVHGKGHAPSQIIYEKIDALRLLNLVGFEIQLTTKHWCSKLQYF